MPASSVSKDAKLSLALNSVGHRSMNSWNGSESRVIDLVFRLLVWVFEIKINDD
jgi:hypothetical protein